MSDLFGTPAQNRAQVAPEPEVYNRAKEAEEALEKVSRDLEYAEADVKKAAAKRDDLLAEITELESKADSLKGEIADEALLDASLTNKEKRDAAVAKALREHARYSEMAAQLQRLKTDLRNAGTDYELATGRVKSLHRRVDAAVTRARLIASQIQTLGYLHQYDTAKLQMGASRR